MRLMIEPTWVTAVAAMGSLGAKRHQPASPPTALHLAPGGSERRSH